MGKINRMFIPANTEISKIGFRKTFENISKGVINEKNENDLEFYD